MNRTVNGAALRSYPSPKGRLADKIPVAGIGVQLFGDPRSMKNTCFPMARTVSPPIPF